MNARLIVLAGTALIVGSCSRSEKESKPAEMSRPTAMGKDFFLTSQSITLPTDENETWPAGPGAEQIDVNCRACHSPSMVLTQPPLSHEEWVKVIDKMRTTYKAAINESDVPMILAYLDEYSARQLAPKSGASNPTNGGNVATPGAGSAR